MFKKRKIKRDKLDFIDDKTAVLLLESPIGAQFILYAVIAFFTSVIIWSSWATLDKVTVGEGKIIPSSQVQVIQNLEGGLVKDILVSEGELVSEGQTLLLIENTQHLSSYNERKQEIANIVAAITRTSQELANIIVNPDENSNWHNIIKTKNHKILFEKAFSKEYPKLVARHQAEFKDSVYSFINQISLYEQQIEKKEKELLELEIRIESLKITSDFVLTELRLKEPLAEDGVIPQIDLLKIQREYNDAQQTLASAQYNIPVLTSSIKEAIFKRTEIALTHRTTLQTKLTEYQDKLSSLTESQYGLADKVSRTIVVSPVKGTIKKVHTTTIGGVIKAGADLIEIVPFEDTLLVEAKIQPQDIAFLRPDLPVLIRFSAYNFTKYGGINGSLEHISADTTMDKEGNEFYIIRVRTNSENFTHEGMLLPIIPGMTATVDIITGRHSVLDYFTNAIVSVQTSALRE